MDPKAFITGIYSEKAKTDSNSQDLARALDVLSKTVFGDVNRFVFELLQNADDAPVKEKDGVEVEFRLLDEYLVFSHNGSHFTEDDVVGISSVGSRMSKKDADIEKTGYKGIGFKSVFGTSDEVHIFSDRFTFRFDKNFDQWEQDIEYPWQVIPIWTDTVPGEVAGYVDIANVNTIIRIDDRNSVAKEIKAVFEDCQIMLFLRNVSKITFYDRSRAVLVIEKTNDGEKIELLKDGQSLSVWMLKDYIVPISEALNKKLNDLSDVECPRKLKDAKNTKLTFAACLEENVIKAIPRALMYCYLPTKVTKGFPFLINGDFLTNAERTDFLPNIWNKFLFATIAVKQLEWLRELQGTPYQFQVMRLFRGKFPTTNISDIETEYNSSLTSATNSIAFLPEEGQNRLLKIAEGIVDAHKFCSIFQPKMITDFLATTNKVIDLRLGSQSSLVDFGAKNFKFEHIAKLISTGRTHNINDTTISTNVIIFLYNSTIE